jgi:cold shock CspA family protein
MKGEMIWFDPDKRHGYIRTDDGERLLVEESGFEPGHLLGDRCAGTAVTFEREEPANGGEPRAIRVTVVADVVARRARRRGR